MSLSKSNDSVGSEDSVDLERTVLCPQPTTVMEMDLPGEALTALENSLNQEIDNLLRKNVDSSKMNYRLRQQYRASGVEAMHKLTEASNRVAIESAELRLVIDERDQAMQDLRNVEMAFSDVHRKYERAKTVIENLKKNEELLTQRDEEARMYLDSLDQQYQACKQELQGSLDEIYHDHEVKLGMCDQENAKLSAQLRRTEMRVETLDAELQQKLREYAQLNTLADELIGKNNVNAQY